MRAGRAALTTLAGAAALWVATPLAALARHGSVDDRTRAAWAREGATPGALAPVLPLHAVPAPRAAADDLLPRGRTASVRSASRGTG